MLEIVDRLQLARQHQGAPTCSLLPPLPAASCPSSCLPRTCGVTATPDGEVRKAAGASSAMQKVERGWHCVCTDVLERRGCILVAFCVSGGFRVCWFRASRFQSL